MFCLVISSSSSDKKRTTERLNAWRIDWITGTGSSSSSLGLLLCWATGAMVLAGCRD